MSRLARKVIIHDCRSPAARENEGGTVGSGVRAPDPTFVQLVALDFEQITQDSKTEWKTAMKSVWSLPLLLHERIRGSEGREPAEVAVRGPELAHAVREAQGGDPGIVDARPDDPARLDLRA
jgi:hypothetical protein